MSPSSHMLRIPITILHAFAISTTSFRLLYRKHKRNLWWDDAWAALGLILDVVYLITWWFRSDTAGKTPPNIRIYYIVLNYFSQMLTTTVLWCARVSIIVTVNRLVAPWGTLKRLTAFMPFLFGAFYIIVISEKIWVCSRSNVWHSSPSVQCFLASPIPMTELCFDIVADLILFIIPSILLFNVSAIAPATRRRLIFVFATSIFTIIATVIYNTFVFNANRWKLFFMVGVCAHMEASVSLVVCNFSVILPIFYRRFAATPNSEVVQPSDYSEGRSYWGSVRFKNSAGSTTLGGSTGTGNGEIIVTTGVEQAFDIELPSRDGKVGTAKDEFGQKSYSSPSMESRPTKNDEGLA